MQWSGLRCEAHGFCCHSPCRFLWRMSWTCHRRISLDRLSDSGLQCDSGLPFLKSTDFNDGRIWCRWSLARVVTSSPLKASISHLPIYNYSSTMPSRSGWKIITHEWSMIYGTSYSQSNIPPQSSEDDCSAQSAFLPLLTALQPQ